MNWDWIPGRRRARQAAAAAAAAAERAEQAAAAAAAAERAEQAAARQRCLDYGRRNRGPSWNDPTASLDPGPLLTPGQQARSRRTRWW